MKTEENRPAGAGDTPQAAALPEPLNQAREALADSLISLGVAEVEYDRACYAVRQMEAELKALCEKQQLLEAKRATTEEKRRRMLEAAAGVRAECGKAVWAFKEAVAAQDGRAINGLLQTLEPNVSMTALDDPGALMVLEVEMGRLEAVPAGAEAGTEDLQHYRRVACCGQTVLKETERLPGRTRVELEIHHTVQ